MGRRIQNQTVGAYLAGTVLSLSIPPLSGCAFMNRDNTPVTNAVEKRFFSGALHAQEALVPAVWPIAAATLAVDAIVVHPAMVVDDALHETRDILWDDFKWDTQYASECFMLPWRLAFTPLVFSLEFLGRAIFDIEPYGHEEAAQVRADELLTKAARAIEQGNAAQACTVLDEIPGDEMWKLEQSQKQQYYLLRLRAARMTSDYTWLRHLNRPHRKNLGEGAKAWPDLLALVEEMLDSDEAYTRLAAFGFARDWLPEDVEQGYVRRQLKDPDPMIRYDALETHPRDFRRSEAIHFSKHTLAVIDELARNDPNPMIRARAAEIVRAKLTPAQNP